MRIAVVRNLLAAGVVNGFGEPSREPPAEGTARSVAEALADDGHTVVVCEGDARLLPVLETFIPPTREGSVTGMVFNLARGLQGEAARAHVPAMLEMAGVPYTGPTPLGHTIAYDTLAWRALLAHASVPTTRYGVMRWPGDELAALRFPLRVYPRDARVDPAPRVVGSKRELGDVVEALIAAGEQEAFVEEYFEGVEVSAALIGNGSELELLPLIEHDDTDPEDPGRVAGMTSTALGMHVGAIAAGAFRAARCQDYACVTLRLDHNGRPLVVHLDSMPRLDPDGLFVRAAVAGDYGPSALATRILDAAHRRYFGVAAPRFDISDHDRLPASSLRLLGPSR